MMACILCNYDGAFRRRYKKGAYSIQDCPRCNLTQLNPLPSSKVLDSLYSEGYFSGSAGEHGYENYGEQRTEYLATFREDLKRVSQFVPTGRVLDVGCGYGFFIEAALEAGYDVFGTDVAEEAIEETSRHFPGRAYLGDPDSIEELRHKKFDVIFASHLIEHITEPAAFLQKLRSKLSDSGIIVLVTPNIGSLLARMSRSRWVSLKVPEHVAFYNPKTISELLRSVDMRPLVIDSAFQYYRIPFLANRVRKLLDPVSRLVPRIERAPFLATRILRVTSGSLRVIANKN